MTREETIDELEIYTVGRLKKDRVYITVEELQKFIDEIKTLEPKTGHWIDITNKNKTVIAVRCSCCEKSPKYAIKSDYCPNCGAKMEEVKE
jgi:Zn finger protein HypA/HybF involved in hydrogenase expression